MLTTVHVPIGKYVFIISFVGGNDGCSIRIHIAIEYFQNANASRSILKDSYNQLNDAHMDSSSYSKRCHHYVYKNFHTFRQYHSSHSDDRSCQPAHPNAIATQVRPNIRWQKQEYNYKDIIQIEAYLASIAGIGAIFSSKNVIVDFPRNLTPTCLIILHTINIK